MTRRRIFYLLGAALISAALLAVASNRATEIRYFTVGLSTTAGNRIHVERTIFDNEWWAAGGEVQGCWQEAGPTTGIFDKRMPRVARVRWHQLKEGMSYEATVQLDEDLARQAQRLPAVTAHHDSSTIKKIYLIIGMEPNGNVTVWLSNAPHENNLRGRVLHVVGEAQAVAGPPGVPAQ
ncbi:MAG: DUF2931 family protein [Desulfuromonadales bacterium]|uniref:DUF2931 family protein n=1 Tax=Desulfuromonas sp. AOP6 TaxID=1566351 RepID=UPI00126D0F48|nr:DUF2931 family protein [Desulfuromonas sp. AOP6]BCA81090.1 hypothetical protein AOP6_2877 [Desulfuromonas sp. AOP6]